MIRILADEAIPSLAMFKSLGILHTVPAEAIDHSALQHADVLLIRSVTPINRDLLQGTPVQWIGSMTAGIDHIAPDIFNGPNIQCVHAPGCNAQAVADHVMACIAACASQHRFCSTQPTIGIIGAGHAGSAVGHFCVAMGWQVLYHDPPKAQCEQDFQSTPLHQFNDCDVVSIHAALHDDAPYPSRDLLGASFFQSLKSGCVLINASRGEVLLEQDLHTAGTHLTLCLDVWRDEPTPDLKTLAMCTIATPHIAGHTQEAKQHATQHVYDQLANALKHAPCKQPMPTHTQHPASLINSRQWVDHILAVYDPRITTQQMRAMLKQPSTQHATTFKHIRHAHQRHAFNIALMHQKPRDTSSKAF